MKTHAMMGVGMGAVTVLGLLLAGARAPAQEAVGNLGSPVKQGAPTTILKRMGKLPTPEERLQTQVDNLKKELAAQKAELATLKAELTETRNALGQGFQILVGHPTDYITKSEWDNMPGRTRIKVRLHH